MIEKIKEDKYLDYNYYINNKNTRIFIKFLILKNNKKYLKNKITKDYKFNQYFLDKNQKEAVFSDEINTLVLAGAGSGKTLTICSKIDYLINCKGIKESEILCISFTNDSVNDLKRKIKYDIDIFTFHKLSLEILNDFNINKKITNGYLKYIINEIFLSIVKNIDEKTLNYFNNIISNFINLFKNYDYNISFFDHIKTNKLLEVIKRIYIIYEDELKSSNLIDFNDIINLSYKCILEKGLKRYYKYIVIDEFQDISYNRYKLIKIIRDSCNSKIFAVGDDYQSIYKFAGSNIKLITNFKKYFGFTRIIKINNTYRYSQELIMVSNKFITKNRRQIKKKIVSSKHKCKPVKIIYYYKNMGIKLKKLLEMVDKNIMILSRNNFDINYIIDEDLKYEDNKIKFNNKEYVFRSVHKSKGLEEDNIIILNLVDSTFGFPNKKEDKILNILLPKDKYLYEEERRLFYVALTRTRNYVYLFVSKDKPSSFVKELLRNNKKYIEVLNL